MINNMRLILVAIGGLTCPFLASATDATGLQPDRVSLFEVALRCPAAPQIGCGSSAKPILLKLEHAPGVSEAWLNRAGTIIAVVWKVDSTSKARDNAVAILKEGEAKEIKGQPRDKELTEFSSGRGWYRGADVDRLSEEEAGIIAARLVNRVQVKTTLAIDKAERLRQVLVDKFRKMFTEGQNRKAFSVQELAGDFLDEKEIATLKEAIQSGVRPLPGEK
jgi:hypothetical protein